MIRLEGLVHMMLGLVMDCKRRPKGPLMVWMLSDVGQRKNSPSDVPSD
jgi:hypothetical protein